MFDYEPSFSAHQIPLVIRAITLQKRLAQTGIKLEETHIMRSLVALFGSGFASYRKFEKGTKLREQALEKCVKQALLVGNEQLHTRVETFDASMACLMAMLADQDQMQSRPLDFLAEEGWVYIPTCLTAQV
jgi:hypothetical protein